MAMEFIWSLSNACDGGRQCYSWLMSKIDSKFEGEGAASLADRMISSWPFELLPGFGTGFDLAWSNVYCARSDCWYNDNFIHAFTITLADTFKNNTTIFLPPLSTPAKSKGDRVSTAVVNLFANTTENLVFMPMNINKNHWTCILLAEVAAELVTKSLPHRFKITAVHSPLQKDNDNCGLFVCLYFWRRVFKEAGNGYTELGLSRRRWDILRTVVNFSDKKKSNEA
ncbi:hypothetical protein PHYSODRAFT_484779 [Phytophthora sojae]|uniref:Ubiquitin-like protease family profile domain-containing protein n=1 Tax=Phytophthora sojae (strain P6497) TaxID=1094619 RepID=G4YVA7_PHYSP|nr:hypothetical protein PHYSODRAFT_484779 [Phytophthora sojae]EGZ24914.1 hypothetical protein PHYSODRAFT_484779 [Phytophthora sojae]|eukprot:XP_009520202.1 hypothetical protein PHYSODRAFT_484779 [Phytophthora sojae]